MNLELLKNPELLEAMETIKTMKNLGFDVSELIQQLEVKYGLKLAQEEPQMVQPVEEAVLPTQLTDEELFEAFRNYGLGKGEYAKGTVNQYQVHLKEFLNWYRQNGKQESIVNISWQEAGDYIHYLKKDARTKKGKPYEGNTINSIHKTLTSFYTYLDEELEILPEPKRNKKRNPFLNVKFIPKDKLKKRKDKVTISEMKQILDTILNTTSRRTEYIVARNYFMYKLMFYCGARASEVSALRIEDVNPEKGTIFIAHGKGDKARYTICSGELKQDYYRYLELRNQLDTDSDLLFISEPTMKKNKKGELIQAGGKPLATKDMNEALAKYVQYSGIEVGKRKITNHTLRHSFVSMMVDELHLPLERAQVYCGHGSIETTAGYLHVVINEETARENDDYFTKAGL